MGECNGYTVIGSLIIVPEGRYYSMGEEGIV
jgi:hypothetical protein